MVIAQDSREQAPLDWKGIEGVEKVEVIGLAFGDYQGFVNEKVVPIVWERKGLGDLFGTLGAGHDRFRRELERAKQANFKLVLMIEGTYSDVWNGVEHSQMDGRVILKILATMYVKYDLEYHFCESRRVMARMIADTLLAIERNYETPPPPYVAS